MQCNMITCFVAMTMCCVAVFFGSASCTRSSARSHPEIRFQAGVEAFQNHDVAGIASAIESLDGLWEFQAHVHLLRGMLLLRAGRLEESMHELGQAKEHPDTQGLSFMLAGEVLYRVGNLQAAESILHEALAFDEEQPSTHRWLAALYYDLGAMRQAIYHLDRVAELDVNDPRPKRLEGLINKDYEKYPRAIEAYQESLRRDPHQHDVRFELAQCKVKLRDFESALGVLEVCPESAEVLTLAAECHYAEGRESIARELLVRALENSPPLLNTLLLQGTISLEQRDSGAIEFLEEATGHYPKDFGLRHKLSQAYRREKRVAEADEQQRLAEELRELRFQFTDLHKEAMDNPRDAQVRHQLGLVARDLDLPELAQNWFRAALVLDPNHIAARQALGEISAEPDH